MQLWHGGSTGERSSSLTASLLSRSALVCSRSSTVCSDFSRCARAFACVLKLPKRLPMCAESNSQHKGSLTSPRRQTAKTLQDQGKRVMFGRLVFSRYFVGVCKCSAGRSCLPCDRALADSPLLGPTGVRAVALRRAFLTRAVTVSPSCTPIHTAP